MASGYPDELNPFGDDGDNQPQKHRLKQTIHTQKSPTNTSQRMTKKQIYYPEQLNPFDEEDIIEATNDADDDYDNSFNPFAVDSDANVDNSQDSSKSTSAHNNTSKIDYDESLNPFEEDDEEPDDSQRVDTNLDHNRKAGQNSRYISSYSSSILPAATSHIDQTSYCLIKSPTSQPHLSAINTNLTHPRRLSPGKRHKKRAAPKPPSEPSPVSQKDARLSSPALPDFDDKPTQYSMTSNSDLENPSLSYSSIQSVSSPSSPVIKEQAQQVSPAHDHNDDGGNNEGFESIDKIVTASNDQLSQIATTSSGHHPDLPIKPSPLRVPSPAIRRSLNSMSSINHSSSSISSQKELPSATCRSHDGSMTNISDDVRPKPLPRTKSLLKKEGRPAVDVFSSPSQNLKEKLGNLQSETEPVTEDHNNILVEEVVAAPKIVDKPDNQKNVEGGKSNASHDRSVLEESQDDGLSSSGKNEEAATAIETIANSCSNIEQGSVVENNQDSYVSNMNQKENSINGSVESFDGHRDDRNAALWRKLGLKKRAAPPLPVNFKRQVFGSLVEIEAELNEIGDKLVDIEERFLACKTEMLKERSKTNDSPRTDPADTDTPNRLQFIELVKEKCDLARRQKDLMYKKREHILDQSHSDIEYELRMIGNKQASSRTDQDDQREQELLKRLVEIIEEKNDIVENLIKDNSISDEDELTEALKRLDIRSPSGESFLGQSDVSAKDCDRKTAAFNLNQSSHDASISKQDKSKSKHRPSTTKALKTLKKYGKVVVKMSKKDNDNAPKSSVTKTPL